MRDEKLAKVLFLFSEKQMAPSEIDKQMKLVPGDAHDAIVGYWLDCKQKRKKDAWEL